MPLIEVDIETAHRLAAQAEARGVSAGEYLSVDRATGYD